MSYEIQSADKQNGIVMKSLSRGVASPAAPAPNRPSTGLEDALEEVGAAVSDIEQLCGEIAFRVIPGYGQVDGNNSAEVPLTYIDRVRLILTRTIAIRDVLIELGSRI